MSRNIRILVVCLLVIFLACGAVTAAVVFSQILPDINGDITTRGNREVYNETWSFALASGEALMVDTNALHVRIEPHDGAMMEASFEGTRISLSNGFLPYIEAVETGSGVRFRALERDSRVIISDWGLSGPLLRGTLTLLIPRTQLGDITVSTFSGDITARGIDARSASVDTSSGLITLDELNMNGDITVESFSGNQVLSGLTAGGVVMLDSSSGNIDIQGLSARSSDIKLFSGNLTAQDAQVGQSVSLSTSSGTSTLTSIRAGSLYAEQFSGDIALTDAVIDNDIRLSTSSGKVVINGMKAQLVEAVTFSGGIGIAALAAERLMCETSSGSVEAALAQGADVRVNTFSGSVDVTLPEDAGVQYTFETFSGQIAFDSAGTANEMSGNGQISGTLGDGKHNVNIETSSGSIILRRTAQ